MPFAAFDLHKKEVEAVILSDLGEVTHRERFPTTATPCSTSPNAN
ncbi:MAG: hypothetical protein ACK5TN_07505 [Acidobacteriota bacterium]|jgi:hypothetical protein